MRSCSDSVLVFKRILHCLLSIIFAIGDAAGIASLYEVLFKPYLKPTWAIWQVTKDLLQKTPCQRTTKLSPLSSLASKTLLRRAAKLYPLLSFALKIFLRRATKIFLKDIPGFRLNLFKPSNVVSGEYGIQPHKCRFGQLDVCSLCFKDLGQCATKHCLITSRRTTSDPKRPCACNRSLLRFATKFLSFCCVTWNLSRVSYLSGQIWRWNEEDEFGAYCGLWLNKSSLGLSTS
jgi:hypothetical protein